MLLLSSCVTRYDLSLFHTLETIVISLIARTPYCWPLPTPNAADIGNQSCSNVSWVAYLWGAFAVNRWQHQRWLPGGKCCPLPAKPSNSICNEWLRFIRHLEEYVSRFHWAMDLECCLPVVLWTLLLFVVTSSLRSVSVTWIERRPSSGFHCTVGSFLRQ